MIWEEAEVSWWRLLPPEALHCKCCNFIPYWCDVTWVYWPPETFFKGVSWRKVIFRLIGVLAVGRAYLIGDLASRTRSLVAVRQFAPILFELRVVTFEISLWLFSLLVSINNPLKLWMNFCFLVCWAWFIFCTTFNRNLRILNLEFWSRGWPSLKKTQDVFFVFSVNFT